MYYGYVKMDIEDLKALSIGYTVLAYPADNPKLADGVFGEFIYESQDPLVVVGNKLYSIQSDTECTLEQTLPGDTDYFGALEEISNYPAAGTTYKQHYFKWSIRNKDIMARVWDNNPLVCVLISYTQALIDGKSLTDNPNFTFDKLPVEITWEKINKTRLLRSTMTKKAAITSDLQKLAVLNNYNIVNSVVDAFEDNSMLDGYNSDPTVIAILDDDSILVCDGDLEEWVLTMQVVPDTADKMFIIGQCISGGFTVEVSNDGGENWESVTFQGNASKISDEVTFSSSASGEILARVTMQKGDLGYNPMLIAWGVIWK